jgi:WD40 repeat protein
MGHTDAVLSCDLSPDERYIVSGSTDNSIRLWEFSTGDCLNVIRKHTKWVKVVKFSPDGRYIASASLDRRVMMWDLKFMLNSKSPTPFRSFDDHQDYVLDIAMHKNLLLTTCRDSKIRIFDYVNGVLLRAHNLSPSWACTVSFSDNGEYFATGSFDNNLLIFKTSDLSVIRQIRVFNFGIMTVKFPKDLSFVIVGSTEGFLQQIPL